MTHIGFDVGGTKIQGAAVRDGVLTRAAKTATPDGYAALIAALTAGYTELTGDGGAPVERVAVGLPGQVGTERVSWVPNLGYLDGRDLAGDLATRFGTDVLLANDAQLALLGEAWRGAASGADSAVLISLGTGIGGALMFGGRIVRGANRSAGAFGWLNQDLNDPSDPRHGNLELRASGRALEELGRACRPPRTTYELIADARAEREPGASIIAATARRLGVAVASIASVLDPQMIVLAGGLSTESDLLAPGIQAAFDEFSSPSVKSTPIVASALGADAALYGTVRAAMLGEPGFG